GARPSPIRPSRRGRKSACVRPIFRNWNGSTASCPRRSAARWGSISLKRAWRTPRPNWRGSTRRSAPCRSWRERRGWGEASQKKAGAHVSPQERIEQLPDEEQPSLLLQIPSPRISDFSPGTVVELRFPGGKKGKGRVEEIPPQTSPIPSESSGSNGTVITAHVDPVGPLWPNLPFGSVVEARRRR